MRISDWSSDVCSSDLICPANLGLQDTEWELTATIEEGPTAIAGAFRMLRIGLEEVRHDYDVVILDPPPAMGFLGVNTLTAADGLLIPVPARQLDYLSTDRKSTRLNSSH